MKEVTRKIAEKRKENHLIGQTDVNIVQDKAYENMPMTRDTWQKDLSSKNIIESYYLIVTDHHDIVNYEEEREKKKSITPTPIESKKSKNVEFKEYNTLAN